MSTLRQEIDRWEADLANITDTSSTDNWFLTVHPTESHREIAETVAALRALSRVALRFERTPEDAQ